MIHLLFGQKITDKNGFLGQMTCFSVDFFPWCDSIAICGKRVPILRSYLLCVVSSRIKLLKLLKFAVAWKGLRKGIFFRFISPSVVMIFPTVILIGSLWRRTLICDPLSNKKLTYRISRKSGQNCGRDSTTIFSDKNGGRDVSHNDTTFVDEG